MHLFTALLPIVVTIAYLLAAARLLSFNRCGYRVRRGMSLLASLMIGALLCAGLDQLLYQHPVSPWQAMIAVLVCVLVYRSRGNVAAMMRFSE
ncbi:MAG: phage holin family protein [Halopseudomonas sp.]|uniref:phage holin family protein n=1 Tax=Halopseudomonas sp. TaxID=2901191 RepID=UPI00300242A8